MRTVQDIREAQQSYTNTRLTSAISSLPPSYVEGFKHEIDGSYTVTINPGITTIQGTRVEINEDWILSDNDWIGDATASSEGDFYYTYLTRTGDIKVDRTPPTYSGTEFYYAHPFYGYRVIGKLFKADKIYWCSSEFRSYSKSVFIAQSTYLGDADYYIDGDASLKVNMAAEYLNKAYGGGLIEFSSETFDFDASIVPKTRVSYEGQGYNTLLRTDDDIPLFSSTVLGVAIKSMRLEYYGSTEIEQYLVDATGDFTVLSGCELNHPGCLGVSLGGNSCGVVGNKLTGGKDKIYIDPQTAVEFNDADVAYVDCAILDSTHFVVVYKDVGNSNYGTAIIGTLDSSNNITYGSEYVFNGATTNYCSVEALDSTHFVVAYSDNGNSNAGTAIIGVVSNDDEIAYGSEYVFKATLSIYTDVDCLDSTHFVVAYCDSNAGVYGTAIVGVVSNDDEIAYGSNYVFNSASTLFTTISILDSTSFVAGYKDVGNSDYGTAIIGVVSNDDEIAYGSEYVFNSGSTQFIDVAGLDSTNFVAVYNDFTGSAYTASIVGTISNGNEIGYGDEYRMKRTATYIQISGLSQYHYVIVYRDVGNNDYGTAVIGTVLGNYIYYSDEHIFTEITADSNSVSGNIVAYKGTDNDGYAQYLEYPSLNSFSIKSSGNNNIITQNQIYGTDGKFIEVGIDAEGNLNDISNNQIYGEHSDGVDKHILYGINIRDDSSRCNVSTNNIKSVDEVAVVNQGNGAKITNIMAEDNGNLIDRGNCESTTAPMVQGETTPHKTNAGTYARSSAQAYEGTYSYIATGNGVGNMTIRLVEGAAGNHGLVEGLTYELSAYVYVPTGGYTVSNVKLVYDDDQVSASYSSAVSAVDTWELLTLEFTVDADSTDLDFGLSVAETGTDSVHWDNIRLQPIGIANEHNNQFVDNGTGTQQASNSWQDYSGV